MLQVLIVKFYTKSTKQIIPVSQVQFQVIQLLTLLKLLQGLRKTSYVQGGWQEVEKGYLWFVVSVNTFTSLKLTSNYIYTF